MIDVIRECRKIYSLQRKSILSVSSPQINSECLRHEIRDLVDGYFRTDRPMLVDQYREAKYFEHVDDLMQQLLQLTHRRSARTKYLATLKDIIKEFESLELRLLPKTTPMIGIPVNDEESKILIALNEISPKAVDCYRQGLSDLTEVGRVSWRGTATEFREALRETLESLAPDKKVNETAGFKLEPHTHRPTMRQKARYVLRKQKITGNVTNSVISLTDTVDEKFGGFVRNVYVRSSGSVHSTSGIEDVRSLKKYVDLALSDLVGIAGVAVD